MEHIINVKVVEKYKVVINGKTYYVNKKKFLLCDTEPKYKLIIG